MATVTCGDSLAPVKQATIFSRLRIGATIFANNMPPRDSPQAQNTIPKDAAPSASRRHSKDHAHPRAIRLRLHDLNQLFNSMDPSPFMEKDLDDDAEEFIVSWAQEYPIDAPLRLNIYLDQWPAEDPKQLIKTAVHNHFSYRARINTLELKRLLKQGRTSLFIGLVFLSACLVISKLLFRGESGTWASVGQESLTIAGWVAMWRPMQIYLYDWWPIRRRTRVYRKLSRIPVEVAQRPVA